jgi:hypothetical protein
MYKITIPEGGLGSVHINHGDSNVADIMLFSSHSGGIDTLTAGILCKTILNAYEEQMERNPMYSSAKILDALKIEFCYKGEI